MLATQQQHAQAKEKKAQKGHVVPLCNENVQIQKRAQVDNFIGIKAFGYTSTADNLIQSNKEWMKKKKHCTS